MKNRIFRILLALIMALSLLPTAALAAAEPASSWDAIADASHYTLDIGKNVTTYNISDHMGEYFRVRTVNREGASSASGNVMFLSELPHEHSFTYATSGDTLTATCSAEGCDLTDKQAIISLTASSPAYSETTYSGTSLPASIEGVSLDAITYTYKVKAAEDSAYSETAPTDAGSYTVKASFTIGSTGYTLTKDFTIARAAGGSAPAAPVVNGTPAADSITIDTVSGMEYVISENTAAPAGEWNSESGYYHAEENGAHIFGGLDSATQYTIHVRAPGDANHEPSASASVAKYTAAATPSSDELNIVDYETETIHYDETIYEVFDAQSGGTAIASGSSITAYIDADPVFGSKLYVRVKADGEIPASAWTVFNVTRMREPTMEHFRINPETMKGKKNASLEIPSRFVSSLEYKLDGDANWTACSDQPVANPDNKPIQLRFKAYSRGFAGYPTTLTFTPASATIAYNFNTNGGSKVDPIGGKAYGDPLTAPEAPVRDGYQFAGWFYDAECTKAFNFGAGAKDNGTLDVADKADTEDVELYAKWIANSVDMYSIAAHVYEDDGSTPVPGAEVQLRRGNEIIAATVTEARGGFNFVAFFEAGIYNIVVTDQSGRVKTVFYTTDDGSPTINMPTRDVSSTVEIKPNTPNAVVVGLDTVAEAQTPGDRESVNITLMIESKATDDAGLTSQQEAEMADISAKAAGRTTEFLDMSVVETVTDTATGTVIGAPTARKDTGSVLEIAVPFDTSGKTAIVVYRYHDADNDGLIGEDETIAFTRLPSRPEAAPYEDATYCIEGGYIYIYTRYFSTYAIGYRTVSSSGSSTGVSCYSATVEADENAHGKVEVSPKLAYGGQKVTITVTPDAGYTLETLTVTKSGGQTVELSGNADGSYTFTMPYGAVKIAATFMEDNSMLNFFVDVPADSYYYDAVLWAAKQGITEGTDATHFSPAWSCTRAQMVTFLWRANGSPEPESAACAFTDVDENAYYYKAALWAAENGYTEGTSATTFSPDMIVTRAQTVTFLWRIAGKLTQSEADPFEDVAEGRYYYDAVLWAFGAQITEGTGEARFSPDMDCTRAQIVTFLYRFFVK